MIEFAKLRYTSDDIRMTIGNDDQLKENILIFIKNGKIIVYYHQLKESLYIILS